MTGFINTWDNTKVSAAYARIDFPNTYEDYLKLFSLSDLEIEAVYKPLGKENEPFKWISETRIAPWVIYVIKKKDTSSGLKND